MAFAFLRKRDTQRVAELKQRLVMDRQMTSLIDRAFLSVGPHLVRDRSNWVGSWLDTGYRVTDDLGEVEAVRGITDEGDMIWMIRHPEKRYGYHASAVDPFAAMDQARDAWARRREIRKQWNAVRALRADVLAGRRKLTVHIEDARDAGLCEYGIKGFLRAFGLKNRVRMPGRALAVLSLFERQAAYALWAAHRRTVGQVAVPSGRGRLVPAE